MRDHVVGTTMALEQTADVPQLLVKFDQLR
jgi:hypothetical protein